MKVTPISFKGQVKINKKIAARHIASLRDEEIKEGLASNLKALRRDLSKNTPYDDRFNIKILTGYYTDSISGDKRYFITHDWLCGELNDCSFQNLRQNIEKTLNDNAAGEFLDIEVTRNANERYRKTIILSNCNSKFHIKAQNLKKEFETFSKQIKKEKGAPAVINPYRASDINKFEKESQRIIYHTPSFEEQEIAEKL